MKISVAISTYCGEKYIVEQLNSIKNQTQKVDEVIISDDCSKDSTVDIIESYISENILKDWKLIKNENNKGWMKNFKEVILATTGDIVFIADQDDIWKPEKVEIMVKAMLSNNNIELLASDYQALIDGNLINEFKSDDNLEQLKFHKKFFFILRPGCSFVVKRKLVDELLPYWNEKLPHDKQLWIMGYLRNSIYIIHNSLFIYRRHKETTTGRDGISLKAKKRNLFYEENGLKLALEYDKNNKYLNAEQKKQVYTALKYIDKRKEYLYEKKAFNIFANLKYIGYYAFYKTFIGDIIAKIKANE